MAMALLEPASRADRFRIDAVDISARALARPARGVRKEFLSRPRAGVPRPTLRSDARTGIALSDTVRRQVRFQQGNLFAADFLPGAAIYDVIFCRNLLIYFDRATQDRAIACSSGC